MTQVKADGEKAIVQGMCYEKEHHQTGITLNGITQKGITQKGITLKGITLKGITLKGITPSIELLTATGGNISSF